MAFESISLKFSYEIPNNFFSKCTVWRSLETYTKNNLNVEKFIEFSSQTEARSIVLLENDKILLFEITTSNKRDSNEEVVLIKSNKAFSIDINVSYSDGKFNTPEETIAIEFI